MGHEGHSYEEGDETLSDEGQAGSGFIDGSHTLPTPIEFVHRAQSVMDRFGIRSNPPRIQLGPGRFNGTNPCETCGHTMLFVPVGEFQFGPIKSVVCKSQCPICSPSHTYQETTGGIRVAGVIDMKGILPSEMNLDLVSGEMNGVVLKRPTNADEDSCPVHGAEKPVVGDGPRAVEIKIALAFLKARRMVKEKKPELN